MFEYNQLFSVLIQIEMLTEDLLIATHFSELKNRKEAKEPLLPYPLTLNFFFNWMASISSRRAIAKMK